MSFPDLGRSYAHHESDPKLAFCSEDLATQMAIANILLIMFCVRHQYSLTPLSLKTLGAGLGVYEKLSRHWQRLRLAGKGLRTLRIRIVTSPGDTPPNPGMWQDSPVAGGCDLKEAPPFHYRIWPAGEGRSHSPVAYENSIIPFSAFHTGICYLRNQHNPTGC